jgi:preprotein translocase subunit SecD
VSSGEIAEAWTDLHFFKTNQPVVRFRFNAAATRNFGDFTTRNTHHAFAIVLDGRAISVLRIMEPLLRGIGEIDGGFTADEAKQLADRINSGDCR